MNKKSYQGNNKLWIVFLAFVLTGIVFPCNSTFSQSNNDTVPEKHHSPRMAMVMSAIIPGAGQIYNNKLWKIPLIYGGGGVAVYYLNYWQQRYDLTLKYLRQLDQNDVQEYYFVYGRRIPADRLDDARDFYRYYRDWSIISIGLIYALNVVDALVDGYLINYDVSDDLSLRLKPDIINSGSFFVSRGVGLTLSLNLK